MKWREKIGYYAKEIKKEMRETGRSTSGDFDSLEGFYADKEKIKKALQEIHDFKRLYVEQLASFSCENSPRYERLLKEIVKILT